MTESNKENEKEVKPMLRKTFNVTKELWKMVQHKCIDEEITPPQAVKRLLIKWVNGDVEI